MAWGRIISSAEEVWSWRGKGLVVAQTKCDRDVGMGMVVAQWREERKCNF